MNAKNNALRELSLEDSIPTNDSSPFSEQMSKCWSGSIDVEDLAMCFGDNRERNNHPPRYSQPSANHRVFRNRNVRTGEVRHFAGPYEYHRDTTPSHVTGYNYNCEYVGRCDVGCETSNLYGSLDRGPANYTWCDNETNNENERARSRHVANRTNDLRSQSSVIGLPCTEEQWLTCTATNCPVYDCLDGYRTTTIEHDHQNAWNATPRNVTYFGPVPPACTVEANLDTSSHLDPTRYTCYSGLEEEQQYLDDYLSNEKRKEKSRDAARSRRSRETDIFTELARALPISMEQPTHLDKASIMRLAIAYLKVRSVIGALEEPIVKSPSLTEMDADFPRALDGFMLVLSSNGDMVYLSDNVSDYLGVSQMEMMGQSVYEYSHPCDHEELRECLSMKPSDVRKKRPCNFFLRLKCTLTSKGRKVNLKSASYKVIHCTGRAMGICVPNIVKMDSDGANSREDDSSESSSKEEEDTVDCPSPVYGCAGASLVIVGSPIPHPSNIETPLGRQTFLSKHSLNMKFTYVDERLAEYLGWASIELLGKSVFEFHHALDNAALDKSFKSLFSKGQCETMAYRFLSRKGGYAWVVTQATLIHCSKQHKPISVVCVNHILSGVECEDEVYSERQLEARKTAVTLNSPVNLPTIEGYETEESSNLQSLPALTSGTPSVSSIDEFYDSADDIIAENEHETLDENNDIENNAKIPDLENDILTKEKKRGSIEDSRPLAVTASIFRSQADLASQDTRRDLANSSATTRITKNTDSRRERTTWCFQDKPILEYEPPPRNNRPQAVTKNVFVPLGLIQEHELLQQHEQPPACRPQTTTASIFAPRTEDMNKGFLTFSEDQPGLTMLKDEPEDLTHLAPTPGDVCVPLEDTPFLSDMLDEFILGGENYCPLLSTEDLPTELPNSDLNDPLTKGNNEMCGSLESSLADSDPFIYRDIPSPCSLSPDLLSPSSMGKSPDQSSLGSLQSPKHNDLVDDMITIGSSTSTGNPITEDEMLMLSINDVIGDEELALRAPYIPMSDQDEALQQLISDDTVMWGPSQPPDKKIKWHQEVGKSSKRNEDSNLARLLKNDTGLTKYNDHGGGLVDPTKIFGQIAGKGSNVSRFERPSKRVHTPITPSLTENKRSRFDYSRLPIDQSLTCDVTSILESSRKGGTGLNYNEQTIDLSNIVRTNEKKHSSSIQEQQSGSRLLLQQLMGRDDVDTATMAKTRDATKIDVTNRLKIVTKDGAAVAAPRTENKEKIGFAGDGGGAEGCTGLREKRQTNSVLMNLLVSGCDKKSGLRTPVRVSDKWSSMLINESIQNQLVRNNGDMDFYAEYPISYDDHSSAFENYLNADSTDHPPRRCRYILNT